MKTFPENRIQKRYIVDTTALVEDYHLGYRFPVKMRNYSIGGMCFESEYALRPGRKVNIQVEDPLPHPSPDSRYAEVCWRRKLSPGRRDQHFGIGVKFIPSILIK